METSKLICWFLYDGNLAFDEVRLLFSCDDLEPQTFMMEHLRKYLTVFSYFYRKMLDRILLYTTLEWVFRIFGGGGDFMAPFSRWGSTASRLEPLRGGSLLFTTKFPEIPGTHFIDLRRMKG